LDNDKVTDSRASEDGLVIRRRRECQSCNRRFTTYERVAEIDMKVIKRNGTRQVFQAEKLRRGLRTACWKRPVSDDAIEQLIARVAQVVYQQFEDEIDSQELGRIVMEHLLAVDEVAYVRFASVYRQFKDVHDFVDELRPILRRSMD
jgi:transcriptional repressor NrdR